MNHMKKLIVQISRPAQSLACILAASLSFSASCLLAKDADTEPKIVSITNPSSSYNVNIGDILSRKMVLEVPAPYQLETNALPKKGTKDKGVELVEVNVETDQQKAKTIYTVNLSYQTFINAATPTVMYLPTEKIVLTGGAKTMELPAWGFWFAPLVKGDTDVAAKNIQPDFKPPLVEISAHKTRLMLFLSMLVTSLLALLYMNADGNWLPFMGGAFAKAHRQIKRMAKSNTPKTQVEEKQALVYVHQAFNHHYGANIFARDIAHFVSLRPSFSKMKGEIDQFFNYSNHSLYSVDARDSAKVIESLVGLSKQLRDCERGI